MPSQQALNYVNLIFSTCEPFVAKQHIDAFNQLKTSVSRYIEKFLQFPDLAPYRLALALVKYRLTFNKVLTSSSAAAEALDFLQDDFVEYLQEALTAQALKNKIKAIRNKLVKQQPKPSSNYDPSLIGRHMLGSVLQDNKDPDKQFERDAKLLKATVSVSPDKLKRMSTSAQDSMIIFAKLWCLLAFLGVKYTASDTNGNSTWLNWEDSNIQFASILCHSSRVLIQLTDDEVLNQKLMTYLFDGDANNYKRLAATHSIGHQYTAKRHSQNVHLDGKELYEGKGFSPLGPCSHYGVNVAIGGWGSVHPFTGNTIQADGRFGHLYICYRPAGDGKPAGLLVGLEQSAPIDRADDSLETFFKFRSTPDQVGSSHGLTGGHADFSVTGGDDWAREQQALRQQQSVAPEDYNGLQGKGPNCYYDSLFSQASSKQEVENFLESQKTFRATRTAASFFAQKGDDLRKARAVFREDILHGADTPAPHQDETDPSQRRPI